MVFRTDNAPENAPPVGLVEGVRETLRHAGRFTMLRLSLMRAEAAEAADHYRKSFMVAAVAGMAAGLAWLALCAAAVLWIARRWWEGDAVPALLGIAAVHLVAALIAIRWLVRRGQEARLFAATRQEFEADKQWLQP